MKRLVYISLLILSIVSLASCHKDDVEKEESVIYEKTLLFFMPYTGTINNLHSDLIGNVRDIKESLEGSTQNNTCVMVFIADKEKLSHLIMMKKSKKGLVADTLKTYTNPSPITVEEISTVLKDVKHYSPTSKYAMCVGSHGEGWMPTGQEPRTRFFGSGSVGYRISMQTLADAITACGMHMQFILFDACYMACIENAYDIKDVTDILVASTSEVMGYGMPYKEILPLLIADEPDYVAVTTTFTEYYKKTSMPYATLAAIDCQYTRDMAAVMKLINGNYNITLEQLKGVQDLDAGHHTPTVYFDMADYVHTMCDDPTLLAYFDEVMEKLVLGKSHTDYIYAGGGTREKVNKFCGVTISDPTSNSSAINEKLNTAWWKATHDEITTK